ncbi:uncharacterized protein DUF982 [Rhizobium sp. ERR 922]|uniref:DUF982 domain-containing protein n=1 Tax=unclassified Rhizobium TaxID=2613769 RepID=UPI0011AC73C7|nr:MULTISPECIES: DUF982 domain-containing protein [unclassified Rhizobium]TWB61670.1 uncharacterized protein DUF982 [Rhizobium sp. ERR 922]TWC04596.1 uncharacterized protein DUF982 [Rhizobium sp. ERR 942]
MPQNWWGKPVTVETQKVGQRLAITSVERAAEFMLQEWPSSARGKAFNRAQGALLEALEGTRSADKAKTAFIAALREGGIYIFEE